MSLFNGVEKKSKVSNHTGHPNAVPLIAADNKKLGDLEYRNEFEYRNVRIGHFLVTTSKPLQYLSTQTFISYKFLEICLLDVKLGMRIFLFTCCPMDSSERCYFSIIKPAIYIKEYSLMIFKNEAKF